MSLIFLYNKIVFLRILKKKILLFLIQHIETSQYSNICHISSDSISQTSNKRMSQPTHNQMSDVMNGFIERIDIFQKDLKELILISLPLILD